MKTKFKFVNSDFATFYKSLEEANKRLANATIKLVPYSYEEAILIDPDVEPRYGECLKKEDFENSHEIYVICKDLEKDSFINGSFLQMSSHMHLDEVFDGVLFEPNNEDIKSGNYDIRYLGLTICMDYDNFDNQRQMWKALTMINNEYIDLTVIILIKDEDVALFESNADKILPSGDTEIEGSKDE